MIPTSQQTAARDFAAFWFGKGYEKGQTQPFLELWDQFGEGSGLVVDRVETNLWDSPWLFLAVVAFLTAEWLLRKKGGLA